MGTLISWTNETWNPVTGCTKVSEGCRNCYAETLSLRFGWSKKPWNKMNEQENVILHPERLSKPLKFKAGTRCFVNSMSDLFHALVPDEFINSVFNIMRQKTSVTFQVLTKRSERASLWQDYPDNLWLGVSVEDEKSLYRVDHLRESSARVKFLSCEPLIAPINYINLTGIHQVIVGGESGTGFRKMPHAWARAIRDICQEQRIPFFFKQSSAIKTEMGTGLREADGTFTAWQEFPDGTGVIEKGLPHNYHWDL